MISSLRILVFIFFILFNPTLAFSHPECNFDSLDSIHLEKIKKVLKGYAKKNLDDWMNATNQGYDSKIPTTIWVNLNNNKAFIDLLFGIKGGHLIGGFDFPWSIPYVDLEFKEEGDSCLVLMKKKELDRSGIIELFYKNSGNLSIGSIDIFFKNDPELFRFSINQD